MLFENTSNGTEGENKCTGDEIEFFGGQKNPQRVKGWGGRGGPFLHFEQDEFSYGVAHNIGTL